MGAVEVPKDWDNKGPVEGGEAMRGSGPATGSHHSVTSRMSFSGRLDVHKRATLAYTAETVEPFSLYRY